MLPLFREWYQQPCHANTHPSAQVVLNVGVRPTVNTGKEAASVECHILHTFVGGEEFYGSRLKVGGWLRRETAGGGLAS